MGLSALGSALSGLRVAQQQIEVISGNVSNASTPGYTRKLLPQSSVSVEGVTIGVRGETIIRNVDVNLERDLWTQISSVGYLDVQSAYLSRIEQFHGAPDAELSLAAELARLEESFAALSVSPDDQFLLASVVDQAVDTAEKFNDFSDLVRTLRNDVQDQLESTVNRINDLLGQIADVNQAIRSAANLSRSTASLEDQRSMAIAELSEYMDISFFPRGDGVLVVQTNRGVELASERATQLYFDATPVSATSYYPDSINGLYVGDPDEPSSVDITAVSPGGTLGGLIELRDVTFPRQQAQIDELAHKMALRFEQQGLRLFTDASGNIPADTAPDPTTIPPTAVEYVGFGGTIQVNTAVLNNHNLVQQGTASTDEPVQPGSNEVIRRILEFTFGSVSYQQATGTIDMRAFAGSGVDLQTYLGLTSENSVIGGRGLSSFATVADLVASANGALDPPAEEFQITFEEARTGTGPVTITINLTNADAQPGANALEQIVAEIDAQILAGAVPASLAADAVVGPNGEIVINSTGTVTIDSAFGATGMTQDGLTFLGLSDGTYAPDDPYFDVQIGTDNAVRIYIEPGDTEAELIDKLILNPLGDAYNAVGDTTGVPGLAYDEVTFLATGELILRPGENFSNPEFGGDFTITGGPFDVDPAAAVSPDIAALGAGNGVNIASALFGSFTIGPPSQDLSPISDVSYSSPTNGSLLPPIPGVSFRENFLGPNAGVSTNLSGNTRLLDFAQSIVNQHTQEIILTESRIEDESSLRDALETQILNDSGVNIDEELGNLIVAQTAYSAAARVITAVDELFDELLRVI
ncbi:MAG: flagellar hook-associated protein FlgK [Alphaproteobacteria bacterium]|nr:flagellar hook-associated protein FlgK [Alphaproteobacteria bacterium]